MTASEKINGHLIQLLQSGIVPWHNSWLGTKASAFSHTTGKPYSFINQLMLFGPGEYLTFNQCIAEHGHVRKGEKSCPIVVFGGAKKPTGQYNSAEEAAASSRIVYRSVFHVDQCVGIQPRQPPANLPRTATDNEVNRIAAGFLRRSGCTLRHEYQREAGYNSVLDRILLPSPDHFSSSSAYYAALFFYIARSTGHTTRLDRGYNDALGLVGCEAEDLVADIASAAMLNSLGIDADNALQNPESYIQKYLATLQSDPNLIVWAAARAEEAVRYIVECKPVAETNADEEPTSDIQSPSIITPPAPPPRLALPPARQPADDTPPPASVTPKKHLSSAAAQLKAMQKAAARFAKSCYNEHKVNRPALAGAFMREGRQCICDGIIFIVYDTPMDGLITAPDGVNIVDPEKFFLGAREGHPVTLPSLDEMREELRYAKKEPGFKELLVKLGDMYIKADKLILAMQMTGIQSGEARAASKVAPLYFAGEGCEAAVMPVRILDRPDNVWEPAQRASAAF